MSYNCPHPRGSGERGGGTRGATRSTYGRGRGAMEGGVLAVPGVEVVVPLVLMLWSLKTPPQSP